MIYAEMNAATFFAPKRRRSDKLCGDGHIEKRGRGASCVLDRLNIFERHTKAVRIALDSDVQRHLLA
jgi:hypothetical protein